MYIVQLDSTAVMSALPLDALQDLDLRTFRQGLVPGLTLGQVARGAQVNRSLLSRIETGKQRITASCACNLARYYSRVSGQSVTAGQVFDMAERIRSSAAVVAVDVEERSVAS